MPEIRPASRGSWLRLCCGLAEPVNRSTYFTVGVLLMAVKYLTEATVIGGLTGRTYTPWDFVNPLLSARAEFAHGAPAWFGIVWIVWSLPFLWIALSMSVRRALDAGLSPWWGLWVLIPLVNLAAMFGLCLPPSNPRLADHGTADMEAVMGASPLTTLKAGTLGVVVGGLYAVTVIQASVGLFGSYGATLFMGTPLIAGVGAAFSLNRVAPRSYGTSMCVALLSVFLAGISLLLFALEGVICLVMAAPIMLPLGVLGGALGKALADRRRTSMGGFAACLVMMPLLAGIEAQVPREHEFLAVTAVTINAPPERVWSQVIGFPEIDAPLAWYFRAGLAAPLAARIEGAGVGATRYCEFTTGEFVEPVRVWDPPHRLGFDVAEGPDPMFELSPYRHVHPPHLDGGFQSTRGEFRLIELPGGRTRLEGRTWYRLDIHPDAYWTVWTDWIIHRIHERVLHHIKVLAEDM